jgi:hypothetical protein
MKNIINFIGTVVLVFTVIGCSNGYNKHDVPEDEDTQASVKILLPNHVTSRSIGSDLSLEETDYYEVVFRKESGDHYIYYTANASSSDSYIELNITVGDYDILLLAGKNHLLLGSSFKQQYQIVVGNNTIDMPIKTLDIDIIVPTEVPLGESYNPTIIINTKNPLISSFEAHPGIKMNDVWDDTEWNSVTNGNVYTYTKTFVAPSTPGSAEIIIWGRCRPFNDPIQFNDDWYIAYGQEWDYLNQYFRKMITFYNPTANVELDAYWVDE